MTKIIPLTYVNSRITTKLGRLFDQITEERQRQDKKWGRNFPDRTDFQWLTILTEEVGEAAKAINDGDEENLLEEVIQCAAVCLSWLELRTPDKKDSRRKYPLPYNPRTGRWAY